MASPAAPASRPAPFAAFSSRDFRFYAAARVCATLAVQAQSVAIGLQIYAITHRPIHLGYVGLAQFLPVAGLSLAGGHAADRFDRRSVLLAATGGFALCSVALHLLSRSPSPSIYTLYAVIVGIGVSRAFFGPAASAFVPSLVPIEHLTNAISWQTMLWQFAAVVGPSLGGAIYAFSGAPGPVYLASALGLSATALFFSAIRVRTGRLEQRPPSLSAALSGLRYVWSNKTLLGATSLDFFAVFLGGAVALLPVYATDILHVDPRGLGLLRGAAPVGAGLMGLYLAFRPLGGGAGPKLFVAVGVFGVATIAFGLSKSFALSLLLLAILGAADMVSVVVRKTLEQAATPASMRGRVGAVNMVFIGASNELGEFESGTAAQWLGVVPSVVVGGVGTLAVVLIWALLFPVLRRVDRLEDVRPEP
jgi:MFS family permease